MLVILASRYDVGAESVVEKRIHDDIHLLTCDDLSVNGWRYDIKDVDSVGVIDGKIVHSKDITGVITRLPYVTENELVRIIKEERQYVAAEMMAFLSSWLHGLRCTVLNRPTPTCLSGPNWRNEMWVRTAASLGIPVVAVNKSVSVTDTASEPNADTVVTVVGNRCIGSTDSEIIRQSILIAKAARVEMLSVKFSYVYEEYKFVGATTSVNILDNQIMDLIVQYVYSSQYGGTT